MASLRVYFLLAYTFFFYKENDSVFVRLNFHNNSIENGLWFSYGFLNFIAINILDYNIIDNITRSVVGVSNNSKASFFPCLSFSRSVKSIRNCWTGTSCLMLSGLKTNRCSNGCSKFSQSRLFQRALWYHVVVLSSTLLFLDVSFLSFLEFEICGS